MRVLSRSRVFQATPKPCFHSRNQAVPVRANREPASVIDVSSTAVTVMSVSSGTRRLGAMISSE